MNPFWIAVAVGATYAAIAGVVVDRSLAAGHEKARKDIKGEK